MRQWLGRVILGLCVLCSACGRTTDPALAPAAASATAVIERVATAAVEPTRIASATPIPPQPTPTRVPPTSTSVPPTRTALPATTTPVPTATPLPVERILDVPLHRQAHALSCEAAALKMAMGALGKNVGEDELLADLAVDPTPRVVRSDQSVVWGDPDVGFVGKWDGVYLKDGYGVYDGPIADVALAYGFTGTTHAEGADSQRLYAAVRQGFPSVVWIPYALTVKGRGSWTTPAGQRIPYVISEHAVVLAGVDEDGVYYADPLASKLQYASYAVFEAAMAELNDRAVVVRP